MAVVSRVARITLTNATGSRTITATAVTQDTAAGGSVSIELSASTTTGTAPPPIPNVVLKMGLYIDDGLTLVREVDILPSVTASSTFHLTADGLSTGAARCGTLRIRIDAQASGVTGYTVNSDNTTGESLPAGTTVTARDQGFIRGSTTATTALSNISAGGGENLPYAYGDSIFHRLTLAAPLYQSYTFTHTVVDDATGLTTYRSGTSSATQTFDRTFNGTSAVNAGFPNGVTTVRASATIPNATLGTGVAVVPISSSTLDTTSVDPRLTATRFLQVNSNVFSTPPTSNSGYRAKADRQSSDLGFVAARITTARGDGVNQAGGSNLGVSYSLRDSGSLTSAITSTDQSTTTQGGQVGWGPLMGWSAGLPRGEWINTVTFKDSTGAQHVSGGSHSFVLLALDPRMRLIVGGGNAGNQKDHFAAGESFVAGLTMVAANLTDTLVDANLILAGSPKVAVCRLNLATGMAQYLDASNAWQNISTSAIHYFSMTASPGDSRVFTKSFSASDTANWGDYDVILVGTATKLEVAGASSGTPYSAFTVVPVLGSKNKHSNLAFDPTGLFS